MATHPSKIRYPDISDKLALMLFQKDIDMGLIPPDYGIEEQEGSKKGSDSCFVDEFGPDSRLSNYEILDEKLGVRGHSCWYIKEGHMHQSGALRQTSRFSGQSEAKRGTLLIRKDADFSDFELRVHFTRRDGNPLQEGGVVLCYQSQSDFYLLMLSEDGLFLNFYKVVSDVFFCLQSVPFNGTRFGTFCEVVKSKSTFFITFGNTTTEFTDSANPFGGVGILAVDNPRLCIDFFTCSELKIVQATTMGTGYWWGSPHCVLSEYFTIHDDEEGVFAPSRWGIDPENGFLTQSSSITRPADLGCDNVAPRGTMLVSKKQLPDTDLITISGYVGASDYNYHAATPSDRGCCIVLGIASESDFVFLDMSSRRSAVALGTVKGDITSVYDECFLKQSHGYPFKIDLSLTPDSDICESSVTVSAIVGGCSHVAAVIPNPPSRHLKKWGFLLSNNPQFCCTSITIRSNEKPPATRSSRVSLRQLVADQRHVLQKADLARREIDHLPLLVSKKVRQTVKNGNT